MEERLDRQEKPSFDATPVVEAASAATKDGGQGDCAVVTPISPRRKFFGLVEFVPGGAGEAGCYNYVGPRNRLLLRLSIVFGGRRGTDGDYEAVYIDGKKCLFDWHRGLLGPGVELIKPPKKQEGRKTALA